MADSGGTQAPAADGSGRRGALLLGYRTARKHTAAGYRRVRAHPATGRTMRWAGLLGVVLVGMLLGVLLGGRITADVGPFRAHLSIVPSLGGGTEVSIPPLGSLSMHTHAGPAALVVRLDSLDESRARALVSRPDQIAQAGTGAVEDLSRGVRELAFRVAGVALLGALVATATVYRSMAKVAAGGGVAVAVLVATGTVAAVTFSPQAVQEPRYDGLLVNAPAVVGDARSIANSYQEYNAQLERLVTNVSRLYSTLSTLPVSQADTSTTRVLHISDLHLNPTAWAVVHTIVEQFNIGVVVDTGDITDWGSEPEAAYTDAISTLGVPYVYIRGNHDSVDTAKAIAKQPNATVLSNSTSTVAGLTFAGVGDPRFTPDKRGDAGTVVDRQLVVAAGANLASTIVAGGSRVDVAMVHDPVAADPLAFVAPVVLAGHVHERVVHRLDGAPGSPKHDRSLLMVEGSTGGAGLRGLESGNPLPLALSVLYFDPTRALVAYDDIRVGGTGLSEVSLERHVVTPDNQGDRQHPTPANSPG